jgi:hypothetical protein
LNLEANTPCPNPATECCCVCQHLIRLNTHPWNQSIGKGPITNQLGWVCLGFHESENWPVGIFSESEHGRRELFTPKETKI